MISTNEYKKRLDYLKMKCVDKSVDAFLVTSEDNLYYLTGKACFPFERPFILIIWADKEPTYFIPRLELEHMSVIPHINDYVSYFEYPAPECNSWQQKLLELLSDTKILGTDLYTRSEIFSLLSKDHAIEAYDWAYNKRFIKSEDEIEMIRYVSSYVKEAMKDFIADIRYGSFALDSLNPAKKSSKQAFINHKFKLDALKTNFISVAWPAPYSAEPHSIPEITSKYLEGPHVMVLSYKLNGYATELERTFFTNKPSEEMKRYYGYMMKARKLALSMLKPGVLLSDIDLAVRELLKSKGLENHIIHRVGHGMGVSNHEGPFVALGSKTILEKGMVMTIEPGIYFEGLGAFRHSDTIVITKTGYENLTDFPDDIESMTITKKMNPLDKLKQVYMKRIIKS